MATQAKTDEYHQEREARLLPVVGAILLCGFLMITMGYFVGNYLF